MYSIDIINAFFFVYIFISRVIHNLFILYWWLNINSAAQCAHKAKEKETQRERDMGSSEESERQKLSCGHGKIIAQSKTSLFKNKHFLCFIGLDTVSLGFNHCLSGFIIRQYCHHPFSIKFIQCRSIGKLLSYIALQSAHDIPVWNSRSSFCCLFLFFLQTYGKRIDCETEPIHHNSKFNTISLEVQYDRQWANDVDDHCSLHRNSISVNCG